MVCPTCFCTFHDCLKIPPVSIMYTLKSFRILFIVQFTLQFIYMDPSYFACRRKWKGEKSLTWVWKQIKAIYEIFIASWFKSSVTYTYSPREKIWNSLCFACRRRIFLEMTVAPIRPSEAAMVEFLPLRGAPVPVLFCIIRLEIIRAFGLLPPLLPTPRTMCPVIQSWFSASAWTCLPIFIKSGGGRRGGSPSATWLIFGPDTSFGMWNSSNRGLYLSKSSLYWVAFW